MYAPMPVSACLALVLSSSETGLTPHEGPKEDRNDCALDQAGILYHRRLPPSAKLNSSFFYLALPPSPNFKVIGGRAYLGGQRFTPERSTEERLTTDGWGRRQKRKLTHLFGWVGRFFHPPHHSRLRNLRAQWIGDRLSLSLSGTAVGSAIGSRRSARR